LDNHNLLKSALNFASQYDTISSDEMNIIMHTKKSVLFNNTTTWGKREADSQFDVTMGSYDGAETCELVGSFLLHPPNQHAI
jgi:hypothetical protein